MILSVPLRVCFRHESILGRVDAEPGWFDAADGLFCARLFSVKPSLRGQVSSWPLRCRNRSGRSRSVWKGLCQSGH
jgi:hypothetical protein